MPSKVKLSPDTRRILLARSARLLKFLKLNAPDVLVMNEISMIVISGYSLYGDKLKKQIKQKKLNSVGPKKGNVLDVGRNPCQMDFIVSAACPTPKKNSWMLYVKLYEFHECVHCRTHFLLKIHFHLMEFNV